MFSKFLALLWFLILILKALMFDLWIFIHKIKRCFWWKNNEEVKNGYQKILRKIQFCKFGLIENSFRSIKCSFRLIEEESRTGRFRLKLYDEILHCLDQLRILFDWSNVLFDWSNRNWVVMYFFIFFDRSWKRFDRLKVLNFEFSLAFWLSVKTLIKDKVVFDEITHVSI